jgi:lipopolysaccharide export system permease protein
VREFLRMFLLIMAAFVAIYVVADFFDRFDRLLKHDARAGAVIRLFLFKVPLIVTQVTPIAVLAAGLIGLGLLARHNEFVALRACGVSIWQIAVPLLAVAGVIGVATFVWNETVVPYCAHRAHTIQNREIKRRGTVGVFTGRGVWYRGRAGFYNIDRVSPRQRTLYGLTVYQLGAGFRLRRIVEVNSAVWRGGRWRLLGARTRTFVPDGMREAAGAPPGFTLPETLDDFRVMAVEPEELSYRMLRRQIKELHRRGVDSSESWVDLHLKASLPAASVLMMLIAIPLAAAGTRVSSLASSIGVGLVLGFGYYVVVAFTRALGQSGALPPALAAWSANALFALVGGYYFLGSE